MNLALFDLDNTLLVGDSDYLWGRFLARKGLVDAEFYERENQRFYDEYKAGTLNILEFLNFSLQPLAQHSREQLDALHKEFMDEDILPIIPQAARDLLNQHREQGDVLLIITATNRFVTAPIAKELGVEHLLATEPQTDARGEYTGELAGTPCFQAGKVQRLEEWLRQTGYNLAHSTFYSDSHNDLPLLEKVSKPVAVDPDPTLEDHARAKGWTIISLRNPG